MYFSAAVGCGQQYRDLIGEAMYIYWFNGRSRAAARVLRSRIVMQRRRTGLNCEGIQEFDDFQIVLNQSSFLSQLLCIRQPICKLDLQ